MAEPSVNQVTFVLVAGSLGMLLMVVAIVFFLVFHQKRMILEQLKRQTLEVEYQRRMLIAVLESQENERTRVSKDLHDDIGMMLMTIRLQVNALVGKETSVPVAGGIQELVDATHDSIRRIAWDLAPTTLERFGLEQTVSEMCKRVTANSAIPVRYVEEGQPVILAKDQQVHLYRVIQESVTNALRHAEPQSVEVCFQWGRSFLIISIRDDGKGFDFDKASIKNDGRIGLGLVNIENRMGLLKAQFSIEKNIPFGTLVKLKLPLEAI